MSQMILCLETLKTIESLDADGQRGLLPLLVDVYLESAPKEITRLAALIASGDQNAAAQKAADLRADHLALGLQRMAGLFERIQELPFDTIQTENLLAQLRSEFRIAARSLKSYVTVTP